jgi:hypothetical protein
MIRTAIVVAAGLALAAVLPAMPAQALAARTFVSAAGSDSNNCANVLTPCRHLSTAFAATAQDGEIYVLDPANYGSLTITHGVSIEGHGWASIAPVSGSAAITISATGATDKINIIGVVLDGTAVANAIGIVFNSGGSLTVRDSVIRNFTNDGIDFLPNTPNPSQLFVSNTLVSDNALAGIDIEPSGSGTVTAVLNHVEMENNRGNGLEVSTSSQTIHVTVSDSVSANNGSDGIFAWSIGGTSIYVMVRNSTIANNASNNGLYASGTGASIRVTRSTITGNNAAWAINAGGQVTSYADNNIADNGSNNGESPPQIGYE